ncbi:MAG: hypothetical protein IT372_32625, partial [Polyangiaceae bacterium]|nr:hypothetical protein [Polyangiaceae bacterium]
MPLRRTIARCASSRSRTGEQVYRMDAPADGIARHVEAELVAGQPGGATRTTRLRFDVSAAP